MLNIPLNWAIWIILLSSALFSEQFVSYVYMYRVNLACFEVSLMCFFSVAHSEQFVSYVYMLLSLVILCLERQQIRVSDVLLFCSAFSERAWNKSSCIHCPLKQCVHPDVQHSSLCLNPLQNFFCRYVYGLWFFHCWLTTRYCRMTALFLPLL